MNGLDPIALARAQLEGDRARTSGFPGLYEHKLARMRPSPLAFFRGAAPMFYAILAEAPWLAEGPEGKATIVGDLHLENFGAYRTEPVPREADEVVFDLNDFDDALFGPVHLDVLRLVTSALLGARALGADGVLALSFGSTLLETYARVLVGEEEVPSPRTWRSVRAVRAVRACPRCDREARDAIYATLWERRRAMFRGPMAFPPKPPVPSSMFELDDVDIDVVIAPTPSASPKPDAKVVVVIEDDVATRELLIRGLGTVYTVYAAGDGRAALELLERMAPPDVIVCDVMMPHMDGVTFARAIKQDNAYKHVPIILLTAKDSPMAMIEGINAGARHYLTKPFKIREVLDRIEALVNKTRR